MILIRIAELFMVFVMIKAIWELWQHNKKGVYNSVAHSHQHIGGLLVMIGYIGYDLYSYWYFENHILYSFADRSILFFNLLVQGVFYLYLIDHFKRERTNTVESYRFRNIFKF